MHDRNTSGGNHRPSRGTQGNRFVYRWSPLWWLFGCLVGALGLLTPSHAAEPISTTTQQGTFNLYVGRNVFFAGSGTLYYRLVGETSWTTVNLTAVNVKVNTFRTDVGMDPANGWLGDLYAKQIYSGLVTGVEQEKQFVDTLAFEYRRAPTGVPAGTVTAELEATVKVTRENGATFATYGRIAIEPVTIDFGNGSAPPVVNDPLAPPDIPNPLDALEGEELSVPFYVDGSVDQVELEIGGEKFLFDVAREEGDSGGLAYLDFKVPANWNGMAKINGQEVALAPRLKYTGNPAMGMIANPYEDLSAPVPPGMKRVLPALPNGVTPQQGWGLPNGMTGGEKLPLPAGVTKIVQGGSNGNNLPTGVTRTDGSTKWTYDDIVRHNATRNPVTGTGGGTGGVTQGGSDKGDDGIDEDGQAGAIDAGSGPGFAGGGDAVKPTPGLEGVGTQWQTLKSQISGKFGNFRPLSQGAIPTVNTLAVSFNFGPFGLRQLSMDLGASPFPTIRMLSLVIITFHAGWFFLNFLRV